MRKSYQGGQARDGQIMDVKCKVNVEKVLVSVMSSALERLTKMVRILELGGTSNFLLKYTGGEVGAEARWEKREAEE